MGSNWNGLARYGAAAALALPGCASHAVVPNRDAATDVSEMAPVTRTYVVSAISIPDSPSGPLQDRAPGFNLDGLVTGAVATPANCAEAFPDFTSVAGEMGVDNQFTGAVVDLAESLGGADIQRDMDEQIASGVYLLALTLHDIDSFHDDPTVTLDVALVKPSDCTMDACAPEGHTVRAGQTWIVVTSISTGVAASITNGHFRARVPPIPLSLAFAEGRLALTMHQAVVSGDIISTTLHDDAAIGGVFRVEDIVASFRDHPDLARFADSAAGILPDYADVEPFPDDPRECLSISIGLGITLVDGTLTAD